MDETRADSAEDSRSDEVVVRKHPVRRFFKWFGLGLVVLVLIAAIILWTQRREIASNIIDRELEKAGVQATYDLDRVGLRTQQISNLVLGDPENPDVAAKRVLVQMRIKWDGSVDVYRIVARGVRLRGAVKQDGTVSWGELDKLLPPPGDDPFRLPDVALDIADSSISLRTPWGPLGFALHGAGNLTGGFTGRFASSSPRLVTGNCIASDVRGTGAIEINARKPHVKGPLTADRFACPPSGFAVVDPRLEVDSRFAEAFDSFDASARISSRMLSAGDNALARLNGLVTFKGTPKEASGSLNFAARRSRLGSIVAERTRLAGDYRLLVDEGRLTMVGRYAASDATLGREMISGFTDALAAVEETPVGPVATAIANAIRASASDFDVSGGIRLATYPGGGGARIDNAEVRTATGGRARISGGKGISYYWPSGGLRVDGTIQMAGGGLPTGFVKLNQTASGGMTGVASFRPYSAKGSTLALDTVRFQAEPNGNTRFSTVAGVSGGFSGGAVRGLRVPVSGRIGPNGGLWVGQSCTTVSFQSFRLREIRLGPTRLPICPAGPAILYKPPNGEMNFGARIASPNVRGRIGGAPFRVQSDSLLVSGRKDFRLADVRARLGDPDSPVVVTADRLTGTFTGPGISGRISDGTAVIGKVPLRMSEIDGRWQLYGGDLTIGGNMMLSDQEDPPRFYPLASNDVRFRLSDNRIRATGTLRHPESGTPVTDVVVAHNLETGAGHADLDVPGLTFGPQLQPEELTRLTEGVVALVEGTIFGQGRINWSGEGAVTSSGRFTTRDMDLAAPFGPVTGLATTVNFTDLLGLETAPGQVATVESINPGILVENGVIRYQLLPNQLVKVERGEWPFMGGRLILHETVLNFGQPSAKRLTFEVVGFNAQVFIESLGFEAIEITGIFDGVLPMIFDEAGGRIVGGRLQVRPPGGRFAYTGTKPDAGLVAGVAFDLLSDMHYRNMVIRLDGDLAGEFATRFAISGIRLGQEGGFIASMVRRAFRGVPLKVNLNISGPFRALIQMAKGFEDPTQVIEPVMPFPIDSPALDVVVRRIEKDTDQDRVTRIDEVEPAPPPNPAPGE